MKHGLSDGRTNLCIGRQFYYFSRLKPICQQCKQHVALHFDCSMFRLLSIRSVRRPSDNPSFIVSLECVVDIVRFILSAETDQTSAISS
jgi:hypothetical protein